MAWLCHGLKKHIEIQQMEILQKKGMKAPVKLYKADKYNIQNFSVEIVIAALIVPWLVNAMKNFNVSPHMLGAMQPTPGGVYYPHIPALPDQQRRPVEQEARVEMPLQNRAQRQLRHIQREEGFSVFCFIQCIPFALGWTVAFFDLCLLIWLNSNSKEKITVAFHGNWYWEALFLGVEAGYALFTMCAAGGVVASRRSVLSMYYAWICVSLCAVTGTNVGWMIREFNHGHTPHYQFWTISEFGSLDADLKGHVGLGETKIAPAWMDKIQQNVGCCGVHSFEDWFERFGFSSLPDSCCKDVSEGCGNDFFIKDDVGHTSKVHEIGCAGVLPDLSGMTYKIFHLLLLVKTLETFLFTINLVIWLFCLRKEHPQLVIGRRRLVTPEPPQPSAPAMNLEEDNKGIYSHVYYVPDVYANVDQRLTGLHNTNEL